MAVSLLLSPDAGREERKTLNIFHAGSLFGTGEGTADAFMKENPGVTFSRSCRKPSYSP